MLRDRSRVNQATVVAALLGGVPSTTHALVSSGSVHSALASVDDATTRIGVLVPPFRPGFARGVLAHIAISVLAGELLGRTLPRRGSLGWGAMAGLLMGVVNVGIIGGRIPAIAALPLGPQMADNIAFGVVFAAVADRR